MVPINYRENGTFDGVSPETNATKHHDDFATYAFDASAVVTQQASKHGSTVFLGSHLAFTYIFTILAFYFLHRNWARYIPLRQLFSLELAHSIPARTVMVTALPPQLRNERALAEYFENIHLSPTATSNEEDATGAQGLAVETVTVTRAVGGMEELLDMRTRALHKLESEWCQYLGNPVAVEGDKAVWGYNAQAEVQRIVDPDASLTDESSEAVLVNLDDSDNTREDDIEAGHPLLARTNIVVPGKNRPTHRPHFFGPKEDLLNFLADKFRRADEAVRKRRQGRFKATGVGFVTFQSLAGAQIAAQTVHYPVASQMRTELAPEPRDIHWFNLSLSDSSRFVRQLLVVLTMLVLLSVWAVPVTFLSKLLNWDTIKTSAPKLAKLIGKSPRLRGLVQTSLPSLGLVLFNNLLPQFLEMLSVFQGLQAKSWIEYSLLKKYHVTLLFTTLFSFVAMSTYNLFQRMSESPAGVLTKLATALPGARAIFVSYVIFAGVALMPLQLLELNVIIPKAFFLLFARTPRDIAELNAPPQVSLGIVYAQALLIWTLGITYSIISPVMLPFTTVYFFLCYCVYKHKFLFVYCKPPDPSLFNFLTSPWVTADCASPLLCFAADRPYESRGQAWPLAFNRICWALLIFQLFMLSLFVTQKAFLLVGLMLPLLAGTAYAAFKMQQVYGPLSRFVNLSQACEVARGTDDEIVRLRKGHPVTRSESHLNNARYSHAGDGVYVVGKNRATDFSQPPMSESFPGVLNTGRKRFGHPALSGSLPEPWLPVLDRAKRAQTSGEGEGQRTPGGTRPPPASTMEPVIDALVVDLQRRWSTVKRVATGRPRRVSAHSLGAADPSGSGAGSRAVDGEAERNPWRGSLESLMGEPDIIGHAGEGEDEDEELDDGQGMSRYRTVSQLGSANRGGVVRVGDARADLWRACGGRSTGTVRMSRRADFRGRRRMTKSRPRRRLQGV